MRWRRWIGAAAVGVAAVLLPPDPVDVAAAHAQTPDEIVRVISVEIHPLAIDRNGRGDGLLFDVWARVASEVGVRYEARFVDEFDELVPALASGDADVAIAPLAPTAAREGEIDFSTAVLVSGPQLAMRVPATPGRGVVSALFSTQVLRILLVATAGLAVLGHAIWFVERRHPSHHFRTRYPHGVWDGIWWAAVTVTTVGYGDKAPASARGRLVAIVAMVMGLFLVGAFVTQVTTLVRSETQATVGGLDDLVGIPVGVLAGTSFEAFLVDSGVAVVPFDTEVALFDAARSGAAEAIVANPFSLAEADLPDDFVIASATLRTELQAFGLRPDNPLREEINQALAALHESGEIDAIVARWTA